jgi:hypothetical protein
MCWIKDLGYHERRQRLGQSDLSTTADTDSALEFSGTLLGFDDYVSKSFFSLSLQCPVLMSAYRYGP